MREREREWGRWARGKRKRDGEKRRCSWLREEESVAVGEEGGGRRGDVRERDRVRERLSREKKKIRNTSSNLNPNAQPCIKRTAGQMSKCWTTTVQNIQLNPRYRAKSFMQLE